MAGMDRARRASRRSRSRGRATKPQPPRQRSAPPFADPDAGSRPTESAAQVRRSAESTCGWCGRPITVKATGRLPKWCSSSCRQRAWEQARAAASGLSAVRVVERRVEVAKPAAAGRKDWPRLLGELARQLDDGRIYDRDLLALSVGLNAVHGAFGRRIGAGRGQPTQALWPHRQG
ncbi:MAG: uncharacterized protein JWQ19_2948 [Subtercola sp.]|nr:uncharacterized protein [Subtercola sp.]